MPKYYMDSKDAEPLLDIASYARRGPGRRDRLASPEADLIFRTVRHTPEVMVKVLTQGRQNLAAIRSHLSYLNRHGQLDIETDLGERVAGNAIDEDLVRGWDLDVEEYRRSARLGPRRDRSPPKLVHKLLFSMPPGTPPVKVLAAVRHFAREEFALKHRYAMVLHTDVPHPHVHMVVKSVSEQGIRLHIQKAMLRHWRGEFARHLREQGVPANATERAVRGHSTLHKSDRICRAHHRGASTHMRERVEAVVASLVNGSLRVETGKYRLLETREEVKRGWQAASDLLLSAGQPQAAADVRRFIGQMPMPKTERELLAAALVDHARKTPVREQRLSR